MKITEISPGMKEVLDAMHRVMGVEPPRIMEALFSRAAKTASADPLPLPPNNAKVAEGESE